MERINKIYIDYIDRESGWDVHSAVFSYFSLIKERRIIVITVERIIIKNFTKRRNLT